MILRFDFCAQKGIERRECQHSGIPASVYFQHIPYCETLKHAV